MAAYAPEVARIDTSLVLSATARDRVFAVAGAFIVNVPSSLSADGPDKVASQPSGAVMI